MLLDCLLDFEPMDALLQRIHFFVSLLMLAVTRLKDAARLPTAKKAVTKDNNKNS